MIRTAVITLLLFPVMTLCMCTEKTGHTTPRPQAYHRITPYDTLYRQAEHLPIILLLNAQADVSTKYSGGNTWIDATYLRYGAVLHYTLVQGSRHDTEKALANRIERASMNTGGRESEIIELTSPGGFTSTVIVTPGATVTPVQHIASDGNGTLLYGSLEILHEITDPEETRPIVEAVTRDVMEAAKHLSTKQ